MIKFIEIELLNGKKHIFNLNSISHICFKQKTNNYVLFLQNDDYGYEFSLETYNLIRQYLLVQNFMD